MSTRLNSRLGVDSLLFPVKLGPLIPVMLALFACGYRAVYAGGPPESRLSVIAAPQLTPETDALEAVMSGLRAELGRQGALKSGTAYPRVLVQVLRIDEASLGIVEDEGRPVARGMTLAVTARAWVVEKPGDQPVADTGDVRRVAHSASEATPDVDLQARLTAIRAAAREVGEALARRVLGEAVPGAEAL